MNFQSYSLATESEYGSVKIAARLLDLSESHLNKARVYGGGPPFVKFGASVRYHIPTLLEWAAARTRSSTSQGEAAWPVSPSREARKPAAENQRAVRTAKKIPPATLLHDRGEKHIVIDLRHHHDKPIASDTSSRSVAFSEGKMSCSHAPVGAAITSRRVWNPTTSPLRSIHGAGPFTATPSRSDSLQ
jgi:hypothetical protein